MKGRKSAPVRGRGFMGAPCARVAGGIWDLRFDVPDGAGSDTGLTCHFLATALLNSSTRTVAFSIPEAWTRLLIDPSMLVRIMKVFPLC